MLASFEYQLSKDEYASGLRVGDVVLSGAGSPAWVVVRCIFGSPGFSGLRSLQRSKPGSLDGVITALVILLVGSCAIQTRWARSLRELSFEPDIASRKVVLDVDGIVERHGLAEARWSWDGVRRVYDQSDAVIVQLAGWHLIMLPNRLWPGLNERAEFIQLVRDHATKLLPDVKSNALSADLGARLLGVGAIAAGLDAFVLMSVFEVRLLCPCTVFRMLAIATRYMRQPGWQSPS